MDPGGRPARQDGPRGGQPGSTSAGTAPLARRGERGLSGLRSRRPPRLGALAAQSLYLSISESPLVRPILETMLL